MNCFHVNLSQLLSSIGFVLFVQQLLCDISILIIVKTMSVRPHISLYTELSAVSDCATTCH